LLKEQQRCGLRDYALERQAKSGLFFK